MPYDENLGYRIREVISGEDGLSEMSMFGGLAFLIHGNMAVSASGQGGLLIRVDPAQSEKLLARAHAQPFVMREKEMRGWLRIEPTGIQTKRDLARWVRVGVEYAQSLPPKQRKQRIRRQRAS